MSSKLKKITLALSCILVIMVIAGLIFYRFYLHSFIAETIQTDPKESILLPEKIKPTIRQAKKKLDQEINDIPSILDSLDLDFDDLLFLVETIDSDQVINAINELNNTEIKSEDQVFNILKKNITIKGYDLEIFRSTFKKKATLEKIKRGLKIIEDRKLTTTVSVPVARRTVMQILIDNRKRIEKSLELGGVKVNR